MRFLFKTNKHFLQSDKFVASEDEMLKTLNLNSSTSLSTDQVTTYYKLKYGFENLKKISPDRFSKDKNADAKVFISHSDGPDDWKGIFLCLA